MVTSSRKKLKMLTCIVPNWLFCLMLIQIKQFPLEYGGLILLYCKQFIKHWKNNTAKNISFLLVVCEKYKWLGGLILQVKKERHKISHTKSNFKCIKNIIIHLED